MQAALYKTAPPAGTARTLPTGQATAPCALLPHGMLLCWCSLHSTAAAQCSQRTRTGKLAEPKLVYPATQHRAFHCKVMMSNCRVTAIAFAPGAAGEQGSALRLVSAAADRCARVWDCRACKCLRAARGLPAEPSAAAVARRGLCPRY